VSAPGPGVSLPFCGLDCLPVTGEIAPEAALLLRDWQMEGLTLSYSVIDHLKSSFFEAWPE